MLDNLFIGKIETRRQNNIIPPINAKNSTDRTCER